MASINKDTANHIWEFQDTLTTKTYSVVFDTLNKFLDAKIKASLTVQEGAITPIFTNSNLGKYFTTGTASNNSITIEPKATNTEGFIVGHNASSPVIGEPSYYTIITGEGVKDTANVVKYTGDGTAEGINIHSIIGTVTDNEPTSGYYVAFTGSGNSKISTTGWMTENTSLPAASKTRYFPVQEAEISVSKTGGSITPSVTLTKSSSVTWSDSDSSGVSVTGSGNGSVSNLSIKGTVSTAGYLPTGDVATKSSLSIAAASTPATDTKYITGVTIASGKSFTVTNNGTTTITNSGITTITAGISGSTTKGDIKIVAYPASGTTIETSRTIVDDGRWVETTISAANTWYYGKVKAGALQVTTSVDTGALSDYFNSQTTASGATVTITPKYTNTTGFKTALTTATNSGGITYWKIKTTSVTQNKVTTLKNNNTEINARANVSWGTGWITSGTITPATFAAAKDSSKAETDYVDISNTTAAPVLSSGGYLYINRGYVDDLKISLAKLVPDSITGKTMAPANYILTGYAAFDGSGNAINGTMQIYEGQYTITT